MSIGADDPAPGPAAGAAWARPIASCCWRSGPGRRPAGRGSAMRRTGDPHARLLDRLEPSWARRLSDERTATGRDRPGRSGRGARAAPAGPPGRGARSTRRGSIRAGGSAACARNPRRSAGRSSRRRPSRSAPGAGGAPARQRRPASGAAGRSRGPGLGVRRSGPSGWSAASPDRPTTRRSSSRCPACRPGPAIGSADTPGRSSWRWPASIEAGVGRRVRGVGRAGVRRRSPGTTSEVHRRPRSCPGDGCRPGSGS